MANGPANPAQKSESDRKPISSLTIFPELNRREDMFNLLLV
jgi:hypothetical protein